MTLDDLRLGKDERGAIIGPTGCGKTELAKQLLPAEGRLAIIDPKRLCSYAHNVEIFSDARKIVRAKPDRFIYRPKPDDLKRMDLYNLVYKYCYEKKNFFVYTDDVVAIMERTKYPAMFQVCYQMGREHKVRMLSSFQRPSWLPMFLLSEACKLYAFRLVLSNDIKRIAEVMPGYDVQSPNLKRFTFLYHDLYTMTGSIPIKIKLPEKEPK